MARSWCLERSSQAAIATHGDAVLAMLLAFVSASIVASINGLVITQFRLPPFIATLGMFTISRGRRATLQPIAQFSVMSDFLSGPGAGPDFGTVTVTFGTMLWVA